MRGREREIKREIEEPSETDRNVLRKRCRTWFDESVYIADESMPMSVSNTANTVTYAQYTAVRRTFIANEWSALRPRSATSRRIRRRCIKLNATHGHMTKTSNATHTTFRMTHRESIWAPLISTKVIWPTKYGMHMQR